MIHEIPMLIMLTENPHRRRLLSEKHVEYISRTAFGNDNPLEHLKRYLLGRLLSEGRLEAAKVLRDCVTLLKWHLGKVNHRDVADHMYHALGVIEAYNRGDPSQLDLGDYGTGLAA